MTLLLLIRHAHTDLTGTRIPGWAPGIHLSERGRAQAEGLARRLAAFPLAAVYASPLERCVETAEPLARAHGLPVRSRDALGEVRYGTWTGRSIRQLARTRLWRVVQHTPSQVRFPGGETLLEVQDRAVREVQRIAAAHPGRPVALVTHADVIRLVLAHHAGLHPDLIQRIVVDPVSVSALYLGDRIPRIVRVNDTGDLADLRPGRGRGNVRG